MKFIKERLIECRKKKRLKQAEFARLIGLSVPTVTRLENGKSDPKTEDLIKIANILNTSTAYLLGETDDAGIQQLSPSPANIISDDVYGGALTLNNGDGNLVHNSIATPNSGENVANEKAESGIVFERDSGGNKVRLVFPKDVPEKVIISIVTELMKERA